MGLFGKIKEPKLQPESTGLIAEYKVIYKGGLLEYPKAKVAALMFQIFPDRFEIHPTNASKWFKSEVIPYSIINDLKIAQRQVSFTEGMLGGLNSRQLNQANNIHINYLRNGSEVLLRLEMLSGFNVMSQAKKCLELEDRLNTHNIKEKFNHTKAQGESVSNNIVDEIKKLSELRKQGVLTEQEFSDAKAKLLK